MKISDREFNISNIIDVYKGHIPLDFISCKNRRSDGFVFIQSGNAEYIFNGKRVLATPQSILFLSKNSNYEIEVKDDNYSFICIDFNFTNTGDIILENEIYTSKKILNLENTFEKIDFLWHLGNLSDRIYCLSSLYNIYSEIVKSVFSRYVSTTKRKKLDNMSLYISENISNPDLNVKNLSEMCNISEVHLRRIFSYVYHTSPIKYITSVRIKKAKELLLDQKISFNEISRLCGFKNQYYFAKIFKSKTNMTPTEYRQSYKQSIT